VCAAMRLVFVVVGEPPCRLGGPEHRIPLGLSPGALLDPREVW
jgi:hypothetical protein